MSRSGYTEDDGDSYYPVWFWRQAVRRAIDGKRGQVFLREMIEALDAMPEKRLIAGELEYNGNVCALGAVCRKRGLDLRYSGSLGNANLASFFNIACALVREIEYMNDEWLGGVTPEQRWQKMRAWAVENLIQEESGVNDAR